MPICNKTNNINNEYVKYKNVYKKNNMPELNLNNNVLNSNNLNSNTNITERRRNNNIGNNGSTFSSLIKKDYKSNVPNVIYFYFNILSKYINIFIINIYHCYP